MDRHGLVVAYLASLITVSKGRCLVSDMILGVIGALILGWIGALAGALDVTVLNLTSVAISAVGAVSLDRAPPGTFPAAAGELPNVFQAGCSGCARRTIPGSWGR